ncbi:MAG: SHOCT domain-containing protein [Desulfovibrio sp.]|jgi:putative membrane protein
MWNCGYISSIAFGGMGFGGGFGMLVGLLLLLLLVYLAVKVFGSRGATRDHAADRRDSLEILKTRLAKGEINVDEFNTLKNVL